MLNKLLVATFSFPTIFSGNRTTRIPHKKVYIFQCSLLCRCRNMMKPHPKFASDGKTDAAIYTHHECEKMYYSHSEAFWAEKGGR